MATKQYTLLFLAFILLLGLSLRYYDIDRESIWADEVITMREAGKSSLTEIVKEVIAMEAFPPGYPLVMHYWIAVFGDSEFSIRLPSLIFGIASVFLLFLIAAHLFGRQIGLLAAFFISTGMLQIVFSQEARLYSLFGFLMLLSTYALITSFNSKKANGQKRWLVVYTIVVVAAFYVNYLTIFGVIFQLLALYSKRASSMKKMIVPLMMVFVLCLPLGGIVIKQFMLHHARWVGLLVSYGFPWYLSKIGLFLFTLPMVGLVIFSIFLVMKKEKIMQIELGNREKLMIGLGFLTIGAVYVSLLDVITRSFVLVRHSYFLVPVVYVMMAKFITAFSKKRTQMTLIMVIILFNAATISFYYQKNTKPDWRGAAELISKESTGAPSILFIRAGSNVDIFRYYFGDGFKDIGVDAAKFGGRLFPEALTGEKEFWLVISNDKGFGEKVVTVVQEKYSLVLQKHFAGIEVHHYSKKI